MRRAVFLDRDGTMIEERHYLADPAGVRLLPGAAEALRRLRRSGFVCVMVTNQSGIARGLLTEADLSAVHDEMARQLAAEGAALDAIYRCPAAPDSGHPDRKPEPGMLRRAAADLDLDLGRSWMIGDKLDDLMAGANAGCRGNILVRTGYGDAVAAEIARKAPPIVYHVVDDLPTAVSIILADDENGLTMTANANTNDQEGPHR